MVERPPDNFGLILIFRRWVSRCIGGHQIPRPPPFNRGKPIYQITIMVERPPQKVFNTLYIVHPTKDL